MTRNVLDTVHAITAAFAQIVVGKGDDITGSN